MIQNEESASAQMAMAIGKAIRESAKKEKIEMVVPPRVEKDPRFLLKMHDVLRTEPGQGGAGGKLADRVQLYRVIGLNLVHLSATAWVESQDQAKASHEAAEKMLAEMLLTRGQKRVVYPRAQLKMVLPVDWKEQKSDQANGLVTILTDPKDGGRQIIVRARIIPKDARAYTAKRDALLERMVDEERRTTPFAAGAADAKGAGGAGGAGAGETAGEMAGEISGGILKAIKRVKDGLSVETRYFVVGDVMVSVRSISPAPAAPAPEGDAGAAGAGGMKEIVEKFIADVKPIRE
jgi:hypothetical protein